MKQILLKLLVCILMAISVAGQLTKGLVFGRQIRGTVPLGMDRMLNMKSLSGDQSFGGDSSYTPPDSSSYSPPVNPIYVPPPTTPYTPPPTTPYTPPATTPYAPPVNPPYAPPATTPFTTPIDPACTPPANPPYTPPANPPYTPPANPPYTPPANPPYTPPANPPYSPPANPPYTPPANPPYTPPANPPYTPPATSPYTPSANPPSYGGGSSYGDSSYNSYTYGPPFGIQSTGEYVKYYSEPLDLSKCGPPPTENPCTPYGPQLLPLPGYPQCYIQCGFDRLWVKPCPGNLVWNSRINVCDWPTVARDPGYGDKYGSTPYGNNGGQYGSAVSYGTPPNKYESPPSYTYGRQKRSTTERKKRDV